MKDGILYRDLDGPFGYAELANRKITDTYHYLVLRYGNHVSYYDAVSNAFYHMITLDNNNELLDIETGEITGDESLELFVTQSGTKIYALNLGTGEILWTHEHSSFTANHLSMCQLDSDSYILLANDYHHVVSFNPITGELTEGSVGIYSELLYMKAFPSQSIPNFEYAILLMGNRFYIYNSKALGYYQFASNLDGKSSITLRYVTLLIIPSLLLVTFTTMIVIRIAKNKKLKFK